jgi:HEAT repeats/PBS lyase HEAT-like repeat
MNRKPAALVVLTGLACLLSDAAAQDGGKVADLVAKVKMGDAKAAYTLGEMGPKAKDAIPALVAALQKLPMPGDSLPDNAALALGKIGPDAVPALIDMLKDMKAEKAWQHAATALKVMGPPAREAVPVLVDVAKGSKDPLAPLLAVDALGAIGPAAKGAVPMLVDLLRRNKLPPPNGRTHIVVTLGKIGPEAQEAVKALQEVREKADPVLRLHIDEALEQIEKKAK